jgi:hypothetical protein
MTLQKPTHTVTLRHTKTGMVSLLQCFSRFHAELTLKVYRGHGWTGVIEARS